MYKLPAYGWSSTKDHIGVYFINPSTEYIGGGASKLDLVCHMDRNAPRLLDLRPLRRRRMLQHPRRRKLEAKSSARFLSTATRWTTPRSRRRPIWTRLAATAGNPTIPAAWHDNAIALWQDALAQAKTERSKWPYEWVNGVDYPHKDQRGTVTGQLVLNDPQAASTKLPHLTVGLAHPDYTGSGGAVRPAVGQRRSGHLGARRELLPVLDRRRRGRQIHHPQCPPRHLYAARLCRRRAGRIRADQHHRRGRANLWISGKIEWQPVRYGKQIWDIGYPDRTGGKFYKGDGANYWLWGWCLRYGDLFPNDITYTIGQSDYHKDWFFEQVPHALSDAWKNPDAKDPLNQRFGWVQSRRCGDAGLVRTDGRGRATTWTINSTWTRPRRARRRCAWRWPALTAGGADRRRQRPARRHHPHVAPTPSATTPTRASGASTSSRSTPRC